MDTILPMVCRSYYTLLEDYNGMGICQPLPVLKGGWDIWIPTFLVSIIKGLQTKNTVHKPNDSKHTMLVLLMYTQTCIFPCDKDLKHSVCHHVVFILSKLICFAIFTKSKSFPLNALSYYI